MFSLHQSARLAIGSSNAGIAIKSQTGERGICSVIETDSIIMRDALSARKGDINVSVNLSEVMIRMAGKEGSGLFCTA